MTSISFYFCAYEWVEKTFLQLVIDEYIQASGDTSFVFVPAWNHVPLFAMLDFLFWPADAENLILKQLSLIKMKPIPNVFTRLSWDTYNSYYQAFRY